MVPKTTNLRWRGASGFSTALGPKIAKQKDWNPSGEKANKREHWSVSWAVVSPGWGRMSSTSLQFAGDFLRQPTEMPRKNSGFTVVLFTLRWTKRLENASIIADKTICAFLQCTWRNRAVGVHMAVWFIYWFEWERIEGICLLLYFDFFLNSRVSSSSSIPPWHVIVS